MNQTDTTKKSKKLPIRRHKINGKRRIVLATSDIAKLAHTSESCLNDTICRIPFRKHIDFVYHNETYLLTLPSTQTVLAMMNTKASWQSYHQITDFLQKISKSNSNAK